MRKSFTDKLLKWHRQKNDRQMPWKGEKDPYKIWLSEVILQQTRVEQGRAYYERFVRSFPTIKELAKAKDEQVFKLWEGLGYYSRCRNLLETARRIQKDRNGRFPDTFEEILQLKGVGPYTAAAISSFAYDLPHAVVDGNVQRVLSRYHGIDTPVDTAEGKKAIEGLSAELLPSKSPGEYNQAIMDFGATVCKPMQPLCGTCVMRKECAAYRSGKVMEYPVKLKTVRQKKRWFNFYVLICGNQIAVRQRVKKDIWQGLYEFILQEQQAAFNSSSAVPFPVGLLKRFSAIQWKASAGFQQQLSHQRIHARFFIASIPSKDLLKADVEWLTVKQLAKKPFPVIIKHFLGSQPFSD